MLVSLLLPLLLFLCGCDGEELYTGDRQTIQYQISDDVYAIVIIQEEGMSLQDAKAKAMQQAAQATLYLHYRYFTVMSQEVVNASNAGSLPIQTPHNMYYQLAPNETPLSTQKDTTDEKEAPLIPAYRIIFKCFSENPPKGAIDACTLATYSSCQKS